MSQKTLARPTGRPKNPTPRTAKTSVMLSEEVLEALDKCVAQRGWDGWSRSAEVNMRLKKSLEEDIL